ncbi:MAG: (deoxy)nucleoside triphosphate pyrophosphohydrolase [Verrucomicrobiaceae bacterium]|nr:(deoxy)nucleoside triphosphate pyrophosphohydrolase [Verrucomicrobiaceae bacterium]
MNHPVPVVCALIIRDERVLIAQRPAGKHLALKWEFPGGKIEPGENPADALKREIREELGCEIEISGSLPSSLHRYERGEIELIPFLCTLGPHSAEPHPHEHAAVRWVRAAGLRDHDLAEADIPIALALEFHLASRQ